MNFLAAGLSEETDAYKSALEQAMSFPALLLTLLFCFLVFSRSRIAAVTTVVAAVCYLPQTETLNFGFHFYAVRLVLLTGVVRVLSRGEHRDLKLGRFDKIFLAYSLFIPLVAACRAPEELTFRLGGLYDTLLSYFLFRCLLKGEADFFAALSKIAYVILPFAAFMLYETFTNHNFFSLFHGVAESSWIRNGSTRAQGPFRNPITAGSFGANFAMLFASLRFAGLRARFVLVGLFASLAIVFSAHSSGPFLGLALSFMAFFAWRFRTRLKTILYGLLGGLLVLALAMNAPIWFLIGRISEITGGGGYHRSMLIEKAVEYFDRWWLIGTSNTIDWFPYSINGKADITNFFILAGVDAGLIGLALAFALVITAFKTLNRAIKARPGRPGQMLLWGLGAALVGNLGILISVTYADQMQLIWYFLLVSIATLTAVPRPVLQPIPVVPMRPLRPVKYR
jgi:hypothetical protein